jgi:hypothetical protein
MWVTTGAGKLVNLDLVQAVAVEGAKLVAQFQGGTGRETLIEAAKATPDEYMAKLAQGLASGVSHLDLRQ